MKKTIAETTTAGYYALTFNQISARNMALTPHRLSADGNYARTNAGLFRWSDSRNAWIQIDRDTPAGEIR